MRPFLSSRMAFAIGWTNGSVDGLNHTLAGVFSRINRIGRISTHTANGICATGQSSNGKYDGNRNDR